jgi:hypothetical protein
MRPKPLPRPLAERSDAQPCVAAPQPVAASFRAKATEVFEAGLVPVPCGGPDGKRPLIAYRDLELKLTRAYLEGLLIAPVTETAGIGVLTGAGRLPITVVDVDDTAIIPSIEDWFGPTSIVVGTPSGGRHFWYRFGGERSANLRRAGLAADIKGAGGFVVIPPTRKPDDGGGNYQFLRGGLEQLSELRFIAPGGAALLSPHAGDAEVAGEPIPHYGSSAAARKVPSGERNVTCHRWALRLARNVGDLEALIGSLMDVNRSICDPPLPMEEIRRIAASAWRCQQLGRNWVGSAGVTRITTEEGQRLRSVGALALLVCLRRNHGSRRGDFAISPRAMAEAGVVWDLGERAIRRARDELIEAGLLELSHRGGNGPRDPSRYRLVEPAPGVREV